ncbi:MAG TPA: hypothetical protein VEK79_04130 [Thermoanaerobaculia bacterium]|nr:hypothetical protein [Thermoanaerobaculia bacterium]
MAKPKNLKTDFRPHDKWLVTAFTLGPMSALMNLTTSYFLTPESCVQGSKLMLHISAAAFLLLSSLAAFIAWRVREKIGAPQTDPLHERTHWLANSAIVLAIGSAVVIVAMEIPNLILRSCD